MNGLNVGDDIHPKTGTIQAQNGAMTIAEALAETAPDADRLAVHMKKPPAGVTATFPDGSVVENDPAQLEMTIADTGTAATDTVIRAMRMEDGRHGDIAMHAHDHAHHENHAVLLRRH